MPQSPRRHPRPAAPSHRRITALLVSASALLAQSTARAEEGRFDAQVFRPSAAPRNLVMPTGSTNDFTGDGVVTGGPSIIADYRFGFGAFLSANMGLWLRPDRQFAGVRVGDMASFGLGAEVYVIRRWGLSVIGEVYGYPSLTKFPDAPTQVPAEFLLGVRGQSKHGITVTVGGSFGAACSFGAPAFRLWSSITWQPETSREQEEINRIKEGQEADPDHDGLIGDADHCPNVAGRPENFGCPDKDSDGDGIPDREDECPDIPGGPEGRRGCPAAYIKGDQIALADEIHFADGTDIILDESKPVLLHVAEVLTEHEEIRQVQIEEHTDIHEADAHSVTLSQRRVDHVMKYLIEERRIEPSRLVAKGFGHLEPIADDTGCVGPEEKLTPACRSSMLKNRGVVIRILRRGAPPSRALVGADGKAAVLPSLDALLPGTVLPWKGVLPRKRGVLGESHVLPETHVLLDKTSGTLPWSVLPFLSTWRPKPEAPKDAPKDAAPTEAPKDAPK